MTVDDWFDLMREAKLQELSWTLILDDRNANLSMLRTRAPDGQTVDPICALCNHIVGEVKYHEAWLWALRAVFGHDLDARAVLAAEHISNASDHRLAWIEKCDKYYSETNRIAPIRRRLGAFFSIPEQYL